MDDAKRAKRRDPAIDPPMSQRPSATFLNITIDMAVANDFEKDHGHLCGTQLVAAWAATLHPPGLDSEQVEKLRWRSVAKDATASPAS